VKQDSFTEGLDWVVVIRRGIFDHTGVLLCLKALKSRYAHNGKRIIPQSYHSAPFVNKYKDIIQAESVL